MDGALGIISISAVRLEVTRMSYGRSHRGNPASSKIDWNVRMSCMDSSSCLQSSPSLTMTAARSHPARAPWGDRLRIRSFRLAHFSPYTSVTPAFGTEAGVATPALPFSLLSSLFLLLTGPVGVASESEVPATSPFAWFAFCAGDPAADPSTDPDAEPGADAERCEPLATSSASPSRGRSRSRSRSSPWYTAPDSIVAIVAVGGVSLCCWAMCMRASWDGMRLCLGLLMERSSPPRTISSTRTRGVVRTTGVGVGAAGSSRFGHRQRPMLHQMVELTHCFVCTSPSTRADLEVSALGTMSRCSRTRTAGPSPRISSSAAWILGDDMDVCRKFCDILPIHVPPPICGAVPAMVGVIADD